MIRLISLLCISTLILIELNALPFVRIGDKGGFWPFMKWVCPKCNPAIRMSNWGGNFQFSTQNIQYPRNASEVQAIVKNAKGRIRVVGTRHSFSTIADSTDTIISTLHLNNILGLDPSVPSVTVEPGITYTDLSPFLENYNLSLPNLASLAEISVAGASQTGAHGSGFHGNLATQIRSLQIVLADGTLATYGPNDPEIKALALGLGVFGVITQIELNVQPTFKLINHVFENMTNDDVLNHFDEIENKGYTVQFFTDFSIPNNVWNQVWINVLANNDTVGNSPNLFSATRADKQVTPIAALPATYIMQQQVAQPWLNGLVDYRLGLSGFDGAEIQTEWILPYTNAVPAIKAVVQFGNEIRPNAYTMLIRTIEADDLWMSAEYQQRSIAIHFTWKPNMTAVLDIIPKIENAIKPFKAKPHWGKVYTMKPSDYLKYYPKLKDFTKLANKLDPTHRFRNSYIDQNVLLPSNNPSSSSSSSSSGSWGSHQFPWG